MVGNTSYITFTISSIKKELYFTILCLILISSIKYYELPPKPIQPPSFYKKAKTPPHSTYKKAKTPPHSTYKKANTAKLILDYSASYLYTLLILIIFIVIFVSAINIVIKKYYEKKYYEKNIRNPLRRSKKD
jgi:hypothetical protein